MQIQGSGYFNEEYSGDLTIKQPEPPPPAPVFWGFAPQFKIPQFNLQQAKQAQIQQQLQQLQKQAADEALRQNLDEFKKAGPF